MTNNSQPILEIKNLNVSFGDKKVLKNISFNLEKGKVLGIVGESGSGKSITSLAIMGLLNSNATVDQSSEINYFSDQKKINLTELDQKAFQKIRGNDIAMIFQEPMTSLNPSITCGEQVEEPILKHQKLTKKQAKEKVISLFEKVKLPNPERIYSAYPYELSGGQMQRVMIAIAISCEPKILIADEPTTALDVTVQKSVLELLKDLQKTEGMSVVFISHDLGVIAEVCQDVLVMFRGEVVEFGEAKKIFHEPSQNYTKGLIACRPRLEQRLKRLPTVKDFLQNASFEAQVENEEERKQRLIHLYENQPLLEVKNLSKYFYKSVGIIGKKEISVKAVNDISFKVFPGETMGLVGESGSGKSTLSRSLLLLEKPTSGEIFYNGKDLTKLSKIEIRKLRKEIQIIFQDPYSSLNPRFTVSQTLIEPMKVHNVGKNHNERIQLATEILQKVGLNEEDLNKYPHEFSGGQRQRIGIARALVLSPKFIICDESVSALDVSVQAQVLNLLNDLKAEFGFTYIFISHDLAVVKYMSDQLLVMQHGDLMELGDADEIYAHPSTNYTKDLIDAIPKLN